MFDTHYVNISHPDVKLGNLPKAKKYIFFAANELIGDIERNCIRQIIDEFPENLYWIIVNTSCSEIHKKVIKVEWFALQAYVYMQKHPHATAWNNNATDVLYLMGKPYKSHRLSMLYKLLTIFEDKLQYSFDPGNLEEQMLQGEKIFKRFGISRDYREFAKNQARNLDFDYSVCRHKNVNVATSHYSGYPYDHKLYMNSAMSIVSESEFFTRRKQILTEKTWRPIVNHHPFVLITENTLHSTLEEYGFEMWHLVIDSIGTSKSEKATLDHATWVAQETYDEVRTYPNRTHEKAKHNFETFMRIGKYMYDYVAIADDPVTLVKRISYPNNLEDREFIPTL